MILNLKKILRMRLNKVKIIKDIYKKTQYFLTIHIMKDRKIKKLVNFLFVIPIDISYKESTVNVKNVLKVECVMAVMFLYIPKQM